jgi:hypothetical protein
MGPKIKEFHITVRISKIWQDTKEYPKMIYNFHENSKMARLISGEVYTGGKSEKKVSGQRIKLPVAGCQWEGRLHRDSEGGEYGRCTLYS